MSQCVFGKAYHTSRLHLTQVSTVGVKSLQHRFTVLFRNAVRSRKSVGFEFGFDAHLGVLLALLY